MRTRRRASLTRYAVSSTPSRANVLEEAPEVLPDPQMATLGKRKQHGVTFGRNGPLVALPRQSPV